MIYRILVVDDEVKLCRNIVIKLERRGYKVDSAYDGKTAIGMLEHAAYDAVILDYMLTDMTGLDVLQAIKQKHPYLLIFMLTAYGNVENAVMAMKLGAVDYLNKPIELKLLAEKIETALPIARADETAGSMSFVSDQMKQIREMLERVNQTEASILLLGESGVGKTALAKWIHQESHRNQHPFISLNCAAIPENLLESELFGYEKGAFTGAVDTRIGKFEAANQGTIFLDEIGEMSLATQAKLLHVIEEKRIIRLGSNQERFMDVRIIAATNRNIQEFVRDGKFREDLYYRLNLLEITIPPLRQRKEDIAVLVGSKLQELNTKYRKSVMASDELKKAFETMPWHGNIRELFNVLERMHILKTNGHLHVGDLPANLSAQTDHKMNESRTGKLQEVLEEVEEKMIEDALVRSKGNQTKAADLLGISRNTLIHKIKKSRR
ncbi:sigma-54-dependent transcriptional regulator [Paenibacillus alginolyticus]|uniref:Sigma-54 dependent transcriptional regulator n=1 Tax=Paenibacillus alginolyticus TaxID=59839 RepID=A0ABT4G784_9BACL|nr:sigma-54 dependent transcriptional regulator [Paenibacillus alginolyticus]MCY9692041.1 sigma-54 dependent transcriptional regulator [Paenibacillus alginolyticus]MEC0144231.1 sigma-54 dependent transcriptional regulator [Paenibacillus alginolyticus]